MDKIQKISPWLIGLVALISAYMWWNLASQDLPVASDVDSFYSLTVIMLALVVGITLLFSLYQLVTDMKAMKQALIWLVLAAIIVGVSYTLASDKAITFLGVELGSAQESKMVGAGLYTTYITGSLAILSIVFSPIIKMFK